MRQSPRSPQAGVSELVSERSQESMDLQNSPSLTSIFGTFFRIGLTAFGGPAMIPYIRKDVVQRKSWISEESFKVGLALCQAIPGATVMQLAAYVGLRVRSVPGALVAFAGFAMPACCIITVLSAAYMRAWEMAAVDAVFTGLKVVVLAIVATAAYDFTRKYSPSPKSLAITAAAAGLFQLGLNPVVIILCAAVGGLLMFTETQPGPSPRHQKVDYAPAPWAISLGTLAALLLLTLFMADRTLFNLALAMIKVDLFAFGGFGAFPVMFHEVVAVRGWLPEKAFMDGIALGQVTPGPILLTSAFVGYYLKGAAGALVASVFVFTPSFLILILAVPYCDKFLGSALFQRALKGTLATLGGLLLSVGVTFAMSVHWSPATITLGAAALLALIKKVDVLWVVFGGTLVSFVFFQ